MITLGNKTKKKEKGSDHRCLVGTGYYPCSYRNEHFEQTMHKQKDNRSLILIRSLSILVPWPLPPTLVICHSDDFCMPQHYIILQSHQAKITCVCQTEPSQTYLEKWLTCALTRISHIIKKKKRESRILWPIASNVLPALTNLLCLPAPKFLPPTMCGPYDRLCFCMCHPYALASRVFACAVVNFLLNEFNTLIM
jgi:hypothetical protein